MFVPFLKNSQMPLSSGRFMKKRLNLLLGCIKYLQQNAFTDLPLRSPNKILSYCSSSAFCLVALWYQGFHYWKYSKIKTFSTQMITFRRKLCNFSKIYINVCDDKNFFIYLLFFEGKMWFVLKWKSVVLALKPLWYYDECCYYGATKPNFIYYCILVCKAI